MGAPGPTSPSRWTGRTLVVCPAKTTEFPAVGRGVRGSRARADARSLAGWPRLRQIKNPCKSEVWRVGAVCVKLVTRTRDAGGMVPPVTLNHPPNQGWNVMKILALDLGKFNTMCGFFDTRTREHSFLNAATDRGYLTTVFKSHKVDLVVMEACGPSTIWRTAWGSRPSSARPTKTPGNGRTSNGRLTRTMRSSWHE